MSAAPGMRSALFAKPWFGTFVAMITGLLAGLLIPQSTAERERIGPFATRLGMRLKDGVRRFTDRTISEGLERR